MEGAMDKGKEKTSNASNGDGNQSKIDPKPTKKRQTKKVWTPQEELALISIAKELILHGEKTKNGFKPGFYNKAAKLICEKIPGSTIDGDPHVVSKITSWKKDYGLARDFLMRSGVEADPNTKELLAEDDLWEEHAQQYPNIRGLKHKPLPFYDDWCAMFGKDRATGEGAFDASDMVADMESPQGRWKGKEKVASTSSIYLNLDDDEDDACVMTSLAMGSTVKNHKRRRSAGNDDDANIHAMAEAHKLMTNINAKLSEIVEPIPAPAQVHTFDLIREVSGFTLEEKMQAWRQIMKNPYDLQMCSELREEDKATFIRIFLKSNL